MWLLCTACDRTDVPELSQKQNSLTHTGRICSIPDIFFPLPENSEITKRTSLRTVICSKHFYLSVTKSFFAAKKVSSCSIFPPTLLRCRCRNTQSFSDSFRSSRESSHHLCTCVTQPRNCFWKASRETSEVSMGLLRDCVYFSCKCCILIWFDPAPNVHHVLQEKHKQRGCQFIINALHVSTIWCTFRCVKIDKKKSI